VVDHLHGAVRVGRGLLGRWHERISLGRGLTLRQLQI
jgi:hypothetical protein